MPKESGGTSQESGEAGLSAEASAKAEGLRQLYQLL